MSYTSRYTTREGVFTLGLLSTAENTRGNLSRTSVPLIELCISSWLSLLQDSPLQNFSGLKPLSLFKRFIMEFERQQLADVIRKYCSLGDELLSSSERGITPTFIPEFKNTPVFKEYLYWYKTGDTASFTYLLSFCFFAKKTEFQSRDFNAVALRDWHSVEERLAGLKLPDFVDDLRTIIDALLPDSYEAPCFMGKHGSGAVSDRARGDIEKSVDFKMYPKLLRFVSNFAPHNLRNVNGLAAIPYLAAKNLENISYAKSVSKLMFVPKNFKTARSICMEPIAFMYFQQHFRWELENMIASSLIGRFVKIDDQEWNQIGALYGSRTGNVDTLDLSRASDSVSLDLVRKVFPKRILHGLLSTRSDLVELPDGSRISMNKFAPMGSALCFPVQSIIYFAVVVYAYMLWQNRPYMDVHLASRHAVRTFIKDQIPNSWVMDHKMESIGVYGDDIICDRRVTGIVVNLLEELGFEVNLAKSFTGDNLVRESCGIYALDGKDVTPFTFKCKHYDGQTISAKFLASITSLINRSGDFGYKNLRSHLINYLRRNIPTRDGLAAPIRFTADRNTALSIFSTSPRNLHLKRRTNVDLQREEVKTWKISYNTEIEATAKWLPPRSRDAWDRYAYDMSFRAAGLGGNNDEFVTPRKVLQGAKVSVAWVADY